MSKQNDIDCRYTNEVVCPYCGFMHSDSYEFFDPSECAEIECDGCGKTFAAYLRMKISYVTEKISVEVEDEVHKMELEIDDGVEERAEVCRFAFVLAKSKKNV